MEKPTSNRQITTEALRLSTHVGPRSGRIIGLSIIHNFAEKTPTVMQGVDLVKNPEELQTRAIRDDRYTNRLLWDNS